MPKMISTPSFTRHRRGFAHRSFSWQRTFLTSTQKLAPAQAEANFKTIGQKFKPHFPFPIQSGIQTSFWIPLQRAWADGSAHDDDWTRGLASRCVMDLTPRPEILRRPRNQYGAGSSGSGGACSSRMTTGAHLHSGDCDITVAAPPWPGFASSGFAL